MHAGNHLDHRAHDVGRGAVLPAAARRKGQRHLPHAVGKVHCAQLLALRLIPLHLVPQRLHPSFGIAVLAAVNQAAGHAQQILDDHRLLHALKSGFGDISLIFEARQELFHRVEQIHLPALHQYHRCRGGDRLAHRKQAEDRVPRHGLTGFLIRPAALAVINLFPVLEYQGVAARNFARANGFLQHAVHAL